MQGYSEYELGDLLEYEQPTAYIVESTDYSDSYSVPVLTAGKSFILGYTNEMDGVFDKTPVIIFDDFTTATQYVNFPFKVKSSAMKILHINKDLVLPKYIYYRIQIIQFDHSTHKRYWIQQYSKIRVSIPPIPEQERIVARIEELFSQLDAGVETLKKTKAQLAVYRQAVLKEAFEGRLTEEWRKSNGTTRQGLVRLAREKRDIALARRKLKPLKYEWKDDVILPSIPHEWEYTQIGDIAWSIKDGPHYSPEYSEEGIPFITGGNVRPAGVDFQSAKRISLDLHKEFCKRCCPEKGDMLYTKGGTTGIARVNTYDQEFSVWVHVAVIKFVDSVLPEYFQHVLNSPLCYQQSQKYTHGVGNQDLGLTRMINIIFPICSIEEQKQIVANLESRLSVCDSIEQTVDAAMQQAEAMRQSILKDAFEGRL